MELLTIFTQRTNIQQVLLTGDEKPEVEDVLRQVDELIPVLKFLYDDLAWNLEAVAYCTKFIILISNRKQA